MSLSLSINFYKYAHSNNNGSISADLGSVSVREVGILFRALLPGLLLQYTLHASVCFMGCKCSALRLGNGIVGLKYWQIPVLILKKNSASKEHWNLFCCLHCCYTVESGYQAHIRYLAYTA